MVSKRSVLLALFVSVILIAGFIAAADGVVGDGTILPTKAKNITDATKSYVEKFAEKKNVASEDINNISEVDFNALPKEVNIENVNDNNLAIYQVDYNDKQANKDKQLFVITYSTDKLKSQGDIIVAQDKREFLSFGSSDETLGSGFLDSATGVQGSLNTGYVMMREGSVTGISTNLKIVNATSGANREVKVIVYKNGEPIIFGNEFDGSDSGSQKDYDVQSNGVVTFQAGDVISAYVDSSSDVSWDDVITLIEITTK